MSQPTFNLESSTKSLRDDAWLLEYTAVDGGLEGPPLSSTLPVPTRSAHHFTTEEVRRMQAFESIDYWASGNAVLKSYLEVRKKESRWMKWIIYALIGSVTGWFAFIMVNTVALISKAREKILEELLDEPVLAWMAIVCMSVGLAWMSSAVCLMMPAAAGSGVPDVMAYLNGVMFPKVFNIRTLMAKTVSNICSVSSGLPLGIEGPMIHLGALIGAGIPTGRSRSLRCSSDVLATFRNAKDSREFIAAGAAAGVAAAFRSPVGGLLFVMEEVASFFPVKVAWMTFMCCLCAVFSIDVGNSYFSSWSLRDRYNLPEGELLFEASVLFDISMPVHTNVYAFIPTIVIGIVCGLLAVVFTMANIRIVRFRTRKISPRTWLKIQEPALVVFVFMTAGFLIAKLTSCESKAAAGGVENLPLVTSWCKEGEFHPFASLGLNPSDETLKLLYSRKTYTLFDYDSLCLYFALYTVFACYAGGMFVAGGIVIPSFMVGALVGRILGRGTWSIVDSISASQVLQRSDAIAPWPDPGVFALIGSAAFMAGVSRLTFSLCVIMLEISGDLHQLLFLAVSILLAKSIADRFTHSLYHCLLEVKCVPFLDWDTQVHKLDAFCARDIAHLKVVAFPEIVPIYMILDALASTTHNAFPITKNSTFAGMILRTELELVLWWAKPNHEHIDPNKGHADYFDLSEIRERNFWGRISGIPQFDPEEANTSMDLRPYYDSSAFSVLETTSVSKTYFLFRSLGLRHLVVVNHKNEAVGMITRKDLVAGNLEENLSALGTSRVGSPYGHKLFVMSENMSS
eukprot:PhF_6_TR32120/c0_g1_i1/m.47539/K05016/CLCN7; chloride channel 7